MDCEIYIISATCDDEKYIKNKCKLILWDDRNNKTITTIFSYRMDTVLFKPQ